MSQIALKSPISLTAFHIKVFAAILMVVDHVGYVLEDEWLRIVGRFSFPLFIWLLTQGAKHTKNWQHYQRRLLVLAIASQPIYALFIGRLLPLNAVFQLWLGLILVRLVKQRQMTVLLWFGSVGVATLFFDYGYYGIGLVYLMSSYPFLLPNRPQPISPRVNVMLWVAVFVALHLYYDVSNFSLQIFALPVILLIPFLNTIHERGPKARCFYWFYPLHFIPLICLGALSWHTR